MTYYLVFKENGEIICINEEDAQRLAAIHDGWYKEFNPSKELLQEVDRLYILVIVGEQS